MDDLNEANICRLCLRIVEFSQILGEPEKAMLEDILPDIDTLLFRGELESRRTGETKDRFRTILSMEFYEQALLLALLIKRRKNRKRQRRFWVDPHGAERYKKGMFYNGYRDLRRNNTKFKEYFRMSVGCFDELYSILRDEIAGKDTVMRRCVPAEEKLLLTLRYFSRGTSMASLKPEFLLGVSTISIIIHQVCKSIINTLAKRCIVTPTDQEDWLKIAEAYAEKCNFPNCLGAIGGKNVKISKGKKARRTGPTVVLLATCDTDYRFTYVELDGSDSDYFKDLELHNKVTKNMLHIPPACRLGSSSISAPFVFVGNESFSNTPYLMRPYGGRNLCPKRVNFNARLEEARVMIDRAFAILTSRWYDLDASLKLETQKVYRKE
ncbi:hypothetical protein NQ317_007874 [Molorchus minor]|uniref:DDE Tnp4 domain-containing protein n=1 Tax=Molorchus minor TaxID=1323400 RepID=A0ABQ9J240_9CUCU|nr:hypothetical protein NQ317_007874 [Molorchus minor]